MADNYKAEYSFLADKLAASGVDVEKRSAC